MMHAGRVRFVSSRSRGEFAKAFSALENLQVPETVQAPPLFDRGFGRAMGTRRVRLWAFVAGIAERDI